jgi:Ca-activated chloride channel family protein
MKQTDRVELEAMLRDPAPSPPEGLREAILGDLPAELPVGGSGGGRRWPRWALAATLATAVIGGWTVRELRQDEESTGTSAVPPPAAAPAAAPAPRRESAPSGAPAAAPETVPNVARAVTERAPRNDGKAPVEKSPALPEFRRGAAASEPASSETAAGGETQTQDVVGEAVADSRRQDVGRLAVPSSRAAKVRAPAATPPYSDALTRQAEPVQAAEVSPERFEESVRVVGEAPLVDARRIAASSSVAGVRANPSTGGTREPNDRPYGDVFFREYGTNPFVDAEEDPLSTFGLDVDTASYAVARRYLADGHLPPSEAVRVEEFVNAVPATPGRTGRLLGRRENAGLQLDADGAPTPFAGARPERYRLVRFTVSAPALAARERRPVVLTFVVDTSGSMEREDRLGLVRRALELLLDELQPEDRVGLVVYDSRARVLCEPTLDRARLRRELDGLRPGGSTNAEEGLVLGYEVADRAYVRGAINRVLLASDGVANVGATGPQSILDRIGAAARRGIDLTTVGFGMGNYNDVLMEQLADRGDGQYAYVDTLEEARRVFQDNLNATLDTVARDAKAQVEFDPRWVERYRLLGYENRDVEDRKFRDDRVDAGEIGAGHVVTALYEVKLRPGAERRGGTLATLRVRYRDVRDGADGEIVERSRKLAGGDLARSWDDASVGLRWAGCAAQFAELLKQTYWAKDDAWPDLLRAARPLARQVGGEGRDQAREFADLVERAARLVERRGAHEER